MITLAGLYSSELGMIEKGLVLGLDVGTSAVKALLVRPDGTSAGLGTRPLSVSRPSPGYSEQSPAAIWTACLAAAHQARAQVPDEPVAAIGLSAQRAGVLTVDAEGTSLGPLITWQDNRHGSEALRLARGEFGWMPAAGLSSAALARLLWLRSHAPERLDQAKHVYCTIKDWLVAQLTGAPATDYSSVSISGFYDPDAQDWSHHALKLLRVERRQMSPIGESQAVAGELTAAAARALGLGRGIPVTIGCGDGEASSLGLGAVSPGIFGGSFGTVCALRTLVDRLPTNRESWPGLYTTHLKPLGWIVAGTLSTGGAALAWLKQVTRTPTYEEFESESAIAPERPGDLLFIPHMNGLRSPRNLPDARGVFFGLALHHTPANLARAVMEGVAYGTADLLDELVKLELPANQIRLGGGGTRSDRWLHILAAVTGVPVVRMVEREASALGAAMCAAVAAGWYPSLRDAAALVRIDRTFQASSAQQADYRAARELYTQLLGELIPYFGALARLGHSAPHP